MSLTSHLTQDAPPFNEAAFSSQPKKSVRAGTNLSSEKSSVQLIQTDCLEYLSKLEPGSIDLALLDPPYEISRKTGFKNFKNGLARFAVSMDFGSWDENFPEMANVMKLVHRALREGGTAVVFYDLWKISYLKAYFEEAQFKQLRFIEWVKTNPVPLNSKRNYLTNAREIAVVGVKGSKPTFNSQYDSGLYEAPICHEKGRFHPTQKPLSLISELIEKHSRAGDTVLDCFSGSGTTAVAALLSGRSFKGCELDKEYHSKSESRIRAIAPVGTDLQFEGSGYAK